MSLINLADVFDHGEMAGIVRVQNRRHRNLPGLLVHLLKKGDNVGQGNLLLALLEGSHEKVRAYLYITLYITYYVLYIVFYLLYII